MTYSTTKLLTWILEKANELNVEIDLLGRGLGIPQPAGDFVFEFLKDSGGSIEMNVNGSVTPATFRYTAPVDVYLSRLNIVCVDGAMKYNQYLGIAALTNGHTISIRDGADVEIEDFGTNASPIKLTEDFIVRAGAEAIFSAGPGDDILPIRWRFGETGATILLPAGYSIAMTVRDNVSAITRLRAMAQGVKAPA